MVGAAVLLAGCVEPFQARDEAAIREVMAGQEQAWDRGDIDAFMSGYADDICFIGRKGLTCGKEKVTANYRESYPDRSAMGDLTFGISEVKGAGGGHAWLTGTWQLQRTSDTLAGGFSLLWQKRTEGWRIIRDHSY